MQAQQPDLSNQRRSFRARVILRTCYVVALLVLVLLGQRAHAAEGLSRSGRSLAEYNPFPIEGSDLDGLGLLVVTLLDGRVVAVRQDNGAELWTFDSGTPLVSVKQGQNMAPGLRIFPGVDGGLYAYGSALASPDGDGVGGAKLERLPITLPELVESSPSLTDDGSVILGKRLSRVFVLDRDSGALLQQISEAGVAAAAAAAAEGAGAGAGPQADFGIEDLPVLQMLDPNRIVVVGREDYLVRSVQVHTGTETWNATYSRMVNLRPPGAAAAAAAAARHGGPTGGRLAGSTGALPRFSVGADHTLQAHDAASGLRRWAISFDTPPVGVFTAQHGEFNFLDPAELQPQYPQPHPAAAATAAAGNAPATLPTAGGGAGGGGGGGGPSRVLVGQLRGSLYALPADHVVLEEGMEPQPGGVLALTGPVAAGRQPQPQLPAAASGVDDKALAVIGGGDSSTDVLTYMTDVEGGEGVVSGLVCPPGVRLLATLEPPNGPRDPLPWLPDAARAAARAAASQRPGLPGAGGFGVRNDSGSSSSGGGGGGGGWQSGSGMLQLLVAVLAAGFAGGAAVLVVLRVRGTPAKAFAGDSSVATLAAAAGGPAAEESVAEADPASAAKPAAKATAGQLEVDAVAGSGRAGGAAGGGEKQKRRKAKGAGANGSAAVAALLHGDALPAIEEDHALPNPASLRFQPAAVASTEAGAPEPPSPTAPHLPSGEARVRVNPDGSMAIGRLVVGPGILGYGSAGTIVYEGVLDGRPVAVKRLLRQFASLARKEIEVLILSDEHPNVVRCFALEEDREFVYLALERCRTTLSGFLGTSVGREHFVDPATGQATPRCTSAMLDIVRGLAALHARGIVHRDLKPHNVLLTESSHRAKLSDMGLSKQLVPEASSFHDSTTGPGGGAGGSSGWQAPEQLIARGGGDARQTRAMDVFSLGCILHYCMTGGGHPFGDTHYERDSNILHGAPRLGPLAAAAGPEAAHLVGACLAKEPGRRPPVAAVLGHPLWWSEERRLAFLVDISDRIEFEDREPDTWLLEALESYAGVALAGPAAQLGDGLGPGEAGGAAAAGPQSRGGEASTNNRGPAASTSGAAVATSASAPSQAPAPMPNWGAGLPSELVANLGRYRRYDYTSLRDLLRVVRNKRNHFREMPPQLQALMGPLPGGFLRFFSARFPRLLLSVYVFARQHLAAEGEASLQQYWRGEREGPQEAGAEASGQAFVQTFMSMYGSAMRPLKAPPTAQQQQQQAELGAVALAVVGAGAEATQGPVTATAVAFGVAWAAEGADASAASADVPIATPAPFASPLRPIAVPHAAPTTSPPLPLPPPPPPSFPAPTATTLPPPPPPPTYAAGANAAPLVVVGYEPCGYEGETSVREFPRRPGKALCEFYVKTGHCKFGDGCVFDHPESYAVRLSALGLPLRPEEPLCAFYLKNAECRFGPACKFHHPMLRPVYAGSSAGAGAPPGVVAGAAAVAVMGGPVAVPVAGSGDGSAQ